MYNSLCMPPDINRHLLLWIFIFLPCFKNLDNEEATNMTASPQLIECHVLYYISYMNLNGHGQFQWEIFLTFVLCRQKITCHLKKLFTLYLTCINPVPVCRKYIWNTFWPGLGLYSLRGQRCNDFEFEQIFGSLPLQLATLGSLLTPWGQFEQINDGVNIFHCILIYWKALLIIDGIYRTKYIISVSGLTITNCNCLKS